VEKKAKVGKTRKGKEYGKRRKEGGTERRVSP